MTSNILGQLLARQEPWSKEIVRDGDIFAARVPELSGCFAEGTTHEEALKNLQDALESWLSAALESGIDIPLPRG
jgi:predicted RNase H-like HicB family nuclease